MLLKSDLRKMALRLTESCSIPNIADAFLPPLFEGRQPKDAEFMALMLESGAVGVSYVLLPQGKRNDYDTLTRSDVAGHSPVDYAIGCETDDPLRSMLSLAALNALCQHVMIEKNVSLDFATDSLGLLNPTPGDRIGMVGLFPSLVKKIEAAGAELLILELDSSYIAEYPGLHISGDPSDLETCNKVLCTSTTVTNNTLEDILLHCRPHALLSIVGPTIGYFPDPLFKHGIRVVGGTFIHNGPLFMDLIRNRKRWGPATRKFCFQKRCYTGIESLQRG